MTSSANDKPAFRAAHVRKKWRVMCDVNNITTIDVTIENSAGVNDQDRKALAEHLARFMNQAMMWS